MHLKRLESVGFKSFAERIEMTFVPGMTAVVGPNGSGKSNITEAVRWVLGEQSAKSLRGSKMEDIIFQGSANRHPLNMAEVTLVLDNESEALPLSYAEVSITRRVYRSGESEFYINKKACRLKDIIDLFLDSGLGREAFSMISQGRVEEILSSKAEQRRIIFEEAAGVLKYKQRKHKAEFKLTETEANLERVRDIASELESQIEPLAQQAKTAEQYKKLKAELKADEISLLLAEIEQLHIEWKALLKQLKDVNFKEQEWRADIRKHEADQESAQQKLKNLDEQIERYQEELLRLTENIEKAEGKRQVFLERTKNAAENREKINKEISLLERQVEEAKATHANSEAETVKAAITKEQIEGRARACDEMLSSIQKSRNAEIENLKADYIELLNEQAAMRNEEQATTEQLSRISNKTDIEDDQTGTLATEVEHAQQLFNKVSQSRAAAERDLHSMKQQTKAIRSEMVTKRNEQQQLQSKQNNMYQQLVKIQSRKEMLETMKSEMQGFFAGTKSVLQASQAGKLQGMIGAVIQLIEIPNRLLDAIETALGGASQHIIAENESNARQGIEWLKKQGQGRATFLPLSSIEPRTVPLSLKKELKDQTGYIGIASDLVKYNPEIQRAIGHLLGNVIIARSLKDANDLAALAKRRFRVVTLEGDVVNPGGSMSGGAKKKTGPNMFTRKKELQDVSAELAEIVKQYEKAKLAKQEIGNKLPELEQQYELLDQSVAEQNIQLSAIDKELKDKEIELAAMKHKLQMQQLGKDQSKVEQKDLIARKATLNNKLKRLGVLITSADVEINRLMQLEEEEQKRRKDLTEKLHLEQLDLAKVDERLDALREQTALYDEKYQALVSQLAELNKEAKIAINAKQTNEALQKIDTNIADNMKKKATVIEKLHMSRQERLQATKQSEDEEKELKGRNRQLQVFLKQKQEKEIQATRLDVALENKLQMLQEEHAITYEKAEKTYEKCLDMQATRKMLSEKNVRIERLGTVNLGAIEEYERISERYRFLSEQEADLISAKDTLHGAITELDGEMERRFAETFVKIQGEFTQVFTELFGGGRAELLLTDPGNLLETGIEIVAEPPGKKLKTLSLLSGGERALTAIALLFSILRVRPVPFCILDEVEAALDEANVIRFAKYLHAHSKNTQFIVITHRKGTMEEADALYGITMEESGVSRLVSVRLSDVENLVSS